MFRQPVTWREMDRLRRDMDRLFEGTLPRWQRPRTTGFPAINVWSSKDEGVLVTAELPGIDPSDIDISVTADTLTISGARQREKLPESTQYHRQERVFGEFSRTFQLPYTVNREKVEATVKNGILHVTLPRAEAEKPKQITVQASK